MFRLDCRRMLAAGERRAGRRDDGLVEPGVGRTRALNRALHRRRVGDEDAAEVGGARAEELALEEAGGAGSSRSRRGSRRRFRSRD